MWPNPQFPADLVTFTEEILNGKLVLLQCFLKVPFPQIIDLPSKYRRTTDT